MKEGRGDRKEETGRREYEEIKSTLTWMLNLNAN